MKHAESANPRIVKQMAEAPNQPVSLRFIVPDHQITYRFDSYIGMQHELMVRQLNEFIQYLIHDEPPELANTINDLLISDVSAESAIQIASDWLMLNRLPDRLSAQTPVIDRAAGCWHVPIHLVYADGEHGLLGEVDIDIKTGEVTKAPPIDDLLEKARVLSERIVHARHCMARLKAAAEASDEAAFSDALKAMDWSDRPPEDFVHAAESALAVGAYLAARRISEEGARRYPDHAEIGKYARVLAPPKVIDAALPPDPDMKANRTWMKEHTDEYRGKWVALKDGCLLEAANSLEELVELVDDTTGVLMTMAY
ncbi:MAG: hypothetical protein L0229_23670 [Blastocatellia bacterium]|nr:hypothetical protein [Blastocatellia bacterium]